MNQLLNQKEALTRDTNISSGVTSRRIALKIWFHNALLREEYDDNFNNDECISVSETDDLSLVPSFKKSPTSSIPSANTFDSPGVENAKKNEEVTSCFKKHRLRHLKCKIKSKFHGFKHKTGENNGTDLKDSNDQEGSLTKAVEWYTLFSDLSKNLETLFETEMIKEFNEGSDQFENGTFVEEKEHLERTCLSHSIRSERNSESEPKYDHSTNSVRKHPFGTNLECQSSNIQTEKSLQSPEKLFSGVETENSITLGGKPKICSLRSDSSGSGSDSIEKTPPMYLSRPVDTDLSDTENDNLKRKGTFDEREGNCRKSSIQPSCQSCESLESNPYGNSVKVFTIPTFRPNKKSANITSMIREIESTRLNDKQLDRLAKTGSIRGEKLTFVNKKFYESVPQETNDSDSDAENESDGCSRPAFDGKEIKKIKYESDEKPGARVSFDRYSFLVVYKAPKKSQSSRSLTSISNDSLQGSQNLSISKPVSHFGSVRSPEQDGTRSILKRRPNSKEQEEIKRAVNCDKVDVNSFLDYFEKFESRRQSEGPKLGKFREKQLNHYYSQVFFPELVKDVKYDDPVSNDYTKSRKATELNIGRKIDDLRCSFVHYVRQDESFVEK